MKLLTKLFSVFFALLGLVVALMSVWGAFTFRNAPPMLVSPSEDAVNSLHSMLDSFCKGDYANASSKIYGSPDFGMDTVPNDPMEAMIWKQFRNSFSYELLGNFVSTESGLTHQVRITCMDLDSVTDPLKELVRKLIEERIATAEEMEQIYDENNDFKETFVMNALEDAVKESLSGTISTKSFDITVSLVWRDDQWWILPSGDLLSALSGGMTK